MSGPQFTPGPWEWSATDDERHAVVSPPVDAEHDVGPWFTAIISCADDATENANARLIAAAPELFAELQQFVNGVETGMISSPAEETLTNITRRAKVALAKAQGHD